MGYSFKTDDPSPALPHTSIMQTFYIRSARMRVRARTHTHTHTDAYISPC